MGGFLLQPTTILGSASARMDELSITTRKASAYIEEGPGKVEKIDGRLFCIALRNHDNVVAKVRANIERSGKLLTSVGKNLDTAQQRYDTTEDDNTVAVNDIFKNLTGTTTGQPSLASRGSGTSFGTSLPGDEIKPAQEFEGVPEWAQMIIELGGSLVSPTYWGMKIIEWTIGVNPLDWLMEQVAGDWKGVTKAGSAFTETGTYWTAMGDTLADDCGVLFRGWQGDAADSAESYFSRLISAHSEQSPALQKLGGDYHACGTGMYFTAKGLGALVGMLLDMVAGAAILAAAIAVATASGVGAPAAAAMSAALVAWLEAILGVWGLVLTVQGAAVGAAYLFVGLCAGFLGTVYPVEQLEMPSEG